MIYMRIRVVVHISGYREARATRTLTLGSHLGPTADSRRRRSSSSAAFGCEVRARTRRMLVGTGDAAHAHLPVPGIVIHDGYSGAVVDALINFAAFRSVGVVVEVDKDAPKLLAALVGASDHVNPVNEGRFALLNTEGKSEAAGDALLGDVLEDAGDAEAGGFGIGRETSARRSRARLGRGVVASRRHVWLVGCLIDSGCVNKKVRCKHLQPRKHFNFLKLKDFSSNLVMT